MTLDFQNQMITKLADEGNPVKDCVCLLVYWRYRTCTRHHVWQRKRGEDWWLSKRSWCTSLLYHAWEPKDSWASKSSLSEQLASYLQGICLVPYLDYMSCVAREDLEDLGRQGLRFNPHGVDSWISKSIRSLVLRIFSLCVSPQPMWW